ncbi:MAG: sulfotransferase [Ktedonobacteraceae bacterium]
MKQQFMNTARHAIGLYRNVTSPLRIMPDFIILGVQKGGTTSLYAYLTEHPNIISARMKEVHFFDQHYQKGSSWYRAHFPTTLQKYYAEHISKNDLITGEGSPEYMFYPHAAEKAARLLPNVKMIALLRNPVERAYSQYRHNIRWGHEPKTISFEEVIALEEERTKAGKALAVSNPNYHDFKYQRASYLARGLYAEQLERWMDIYPRNQFLIVRSEDFYKDPGAIYQETLAFLNIPTVEPKNLKQGYKPHNVSKESDAPSKMDPAIRKRLMAYFAPHNDRLYKLLGRDFGWDK